MKPSTKESEMNHHLNHEHTLEHGEKRVCGAVKYGLECIVQPFITMYNNNVFGDFNDKYLLLYI